MEQPKIFISYSREDMGLVRQIRDHVVSVTGLQCWMDTNAVESGTKQFAKDIINNINNSDVFLFMLSNHSQQSEVVLRELDFATKKGKHVVIVNADDCTMTDEFQFLYGLTDTIRWSDVAQRRKLLGDLKRWVGASGPEQERLGDEGQDAERWAKEEQEEQERRIREAERSKYNQRRKGKIEQKIAGEAAKRTKEGTPGEAVSETERRAKEEALREASKAEEPKSKKKTLLWVIIGVVAVLIAVFLFFRWYKKPSPPDPPQPSYGPIVVDYKPDSAKPKEEETFTVNGVSFTMKLVEGGVFQMGAQNTDPSGQNYDSEADADESPVHSEVVGSFYMGETEVTQALWEAVMGTIVSQQRDKRERNDSSGLTYKLYGVGNDYPMYYVSYDEIVSEFLPRLNQLTGKDFCLPTEAEWEYAARGGKKSKGYRYAGGNKIGDVAVFVENSCDKGPNSPDYGTHRVKSKNPNELGLYDMSGNVWEWCAGVNPVLRGGSWNYYAENCRVSDRFVIDPGIRGISSGFRLVLPQ